MRYYWFLSDGKLVRELSFEEYLKIYQHDLDNPEKASLIIATTPQKKWINVGKGNKQVVVPIRQLSQLFPELAKLIVEAEKQEAKS